MEAIAFDSEALYQKPHNYAVMMQVPEEELLAYANNNVEIQWKNILWQKLEKSFWAKNDGGSSRPPILDSISHILKVRVEHPCECKARRRIRGSVQSVVIHLNDQCNWSREAIADWLDLLHEQGVIDITLESPNQDKA